MPSNRDTMARLRLVCLLAACLALTGCSWIEVLVVHNATKGPLRLEYELDPAVVAATNLDCRAVVVPYYDPDTIVGKALDSEQPASMSVAVVVPAGGAVVICAGNQGDDLAGEDLPLVALSVAGSDGALTASGSMVRRLITARPRTGISEIRID